MSQFYLVLALILAIGVTIFATQNAVQVQIRFLVWQFESSLPVVIFGSVAVGALLAGLISVPRIIARSWRIRELQRRVQALTAQGLAHPPLETPPTSEES